MSGCFPKLLPLLEVKIDEEDNAQRVALTDEYSHFEVLKYFLRNSTPSLTLAFKRSKHLSAQN